MEHYAMMYEYLIRSAHQCGRFGVAGANADIFRRFEALNGTHRSDTNNDSLKSKYLICIGEVSAYINTAISMIKKKYSDRLSSDQYTELENIEGLLFLPDTDKIFEALQRADKITTSIQLFPQ